MNNAQLDQIDKNFDKFTAFPIVVNGVGRALYGTAELIAGIVGSIIFGIGQLFTWEEDAKFCEKAFDAACLHMFFGSANIVKGIFEAIPIVNFLVFAYNQEEKPIYRDSWTTFNTAQTSTN